MCFINRSPLLTWLSYLPQARPPAPLSISFSVFFVILCSSSTPNPRPTIERERLSSGSGGRWRLEAAGDALWCQAEATSHTRNPRIPKLSLGAQAAQKRERAGDVGRWVDSTGVGFSVAGPGSAVEEAEREARAAVAARRPKP